MSPLTASSAITQSPLTLNRSAVPLAFVVLTRALLLPPPPSIDPAPPYLAPHSRVSARVMLVMPPKIFPPPPRLPSYRVFLYPNYSRQRAALRGCCVHNCNRRNRSSPPTCGEHFRWVAVTHKTGGLNTFRHASCPPQIYMDKEKPIYYYMVWAPCHL